MAEGEKRILVTGGAGFIGSNFIHYWLDNYPGDQIVNLDKLTYAGHPESLWDIASCPNYTFIKGDITNPIAVRRAMAGVDWVVHFAAESHVDRSVLDPIAFVRTNVLGTATLLEEARGQKVKRFHHVSTDEVFGQLGLEDAPFNEETKFDPRSPYAASKASSDHLVKAAFETYGLPITISNCGNNYGPFHDVEKLIPRFITALLSGQKVPLMGKGENVRDWVYVKDHCRAIDTILRYGQVGERYCVGGEEKSNLEVTLAILNYLGLSQDLIEYVPSRLGHDLRYALDTSKLQMLGWRPTETFDSGLSKTIEWFKANKPWWQPQLSGRPNVDASSQLRFKSKA